MLTRLAIVLVVLILSAIALAVMALSAPIYVVMGKRV